MTAAAAAPAAAKTAARAQRGESVFTAGFTLAMGVAAE